jgi:chaperone protein EcpD
MQEEGQKMQRSSVFPYPVSLMSLMFFTAILSVFYSNPSQAGVVLGGTRIVFDGSKRDASITVSNTTGKPYAVQTWVNTADDHNTTATPFVATPPLFRLNARKEQIVRILKVPGALPEDRESVFYFNAQEIPVASEGEENTLKIAMRTRIKLFYRPAKLTGKPEQALSALRWSLLEEKGESVLQVHNPSAFHVSFIGLKIAAGKKETEIAEPAMVVPMSNQRYALGSFKGSPDAQVIFSAINDYGGYTEPLRVPLASAQ